MNDIKRKQALFSRGGQLIEKVYILALLVASFVIYDTTCGNQEDVSPRQIDALIIKFLNDNAKKRCDNPENIEALRQAWHQTSYDLRHGWQLVPLNDTNKLVQREDKENWLVLRKQKKLDHEALLIGSLIQKHKISEYIKLYGDEESQVFYMYVQLSDKGTHAFESKLKFQFAETRPTLKMAIEAGSNSSAALD